MKKLSEPIMVKLIEYDETTLGNKEIVFNAILGEGEGEREGEIRVGKRLFYEAFGNFIGLE